MNRSTPEQNASREHEDDLRSEIQATVTAYRARLTGPMTADNMKAAEELEDQLYHAGKALRALGKV